MVMPEYCHESCSHSILSHYHCLDDHDYYCMNHKPMYYDGCLVDGGSLCSVELVASVTAVVRAGIVLPGRVVLGPPPALLH